MPRYSFENFLQEYVLEQKVLYFTVSAHEQNVSMFFLSLNNRLDQFIVDEALEIFEPTEIH